MEGKLNRLSAATKEQLTLFACLGTVADFAKLASLRRQSQEMLHEALAEAQRSGLVARGDGVYRFLHDRIREAAYTPETERAMTHLTVARALVDTMSSQAIVDDVFDIVNQFNAGRELITDVFEKDRVAQLALLAGQKAKASTAYDAALKYFAIGMELIGDGGWDRQYDLSFGLRIETRDPII